MRISWFDYIRSFFTKDRAVFLFGVITDDEKQLKKMDCWELAKIIEQESHTQGNKVKRIVAEHLLQVRLARIQSNAAYIAAIATIFGAVIGSLVTYWLK